MAQQRITTPAGMTECDSCNPLNPDCDESGRPYTCYRCCDSGWMPVECLDERPDPDDKNRPAGVAPYQYDPGTGCMVPVRSYPRTDGARAASIGFADMSDDIPF